MGTPIRLVRNDGGIIELMATTLTMNVDRGVSPLAMPFAGGNRFAFDLNLPKSLITIEGVMTDDDILNMSSIGQDASAILDFSRTSNASDTNVASFVADANLTGNSYSVVGGVTLNDPTTATHSIKINQYFEVLFAKQNSSFEGQVGSFASTGKVYIAVHNGTSPRTAAQVATSLKTVIDAYGGTDLAATIIASPLTDEPGVAVELTNINAQGGGNGTMSFQQTVAGPYNKPYHVQFSGGRDSSQVTNKSAGDKVAELFAVLNNSNNGGMGAMVGTAAVAGGAIGAGIATGGLGLLVAGAGVGVAGGINQANYDTKYGDYITAIQIPFSSNVNNRESIFYMPTGSFKQTTHKTVDNALATGTEFDSSERHYTGIKGTVANATFVQLGGEPIYSFTINFAPIDWIF